MRPAPAGTAVPGAVRMKGCPTRPCRATPRRVPNEPAPAPEGPAGFEPPHPNGAVTTSGITRRRRIRRRVLAALATVIAIAWVFAIIYSVTAAGPEHLDATSAHRVGDACSAALRDLRALAPLPTRPGVQAAVDRLHEENDIYRAMVTRIAAVRVTSADKQKAFRGWLDDWNRVIEARVRYADALPENPKARFVIPAVQGIKPVTDKMNDWVTEQNKVVNSCNTATLQIEQVNGPRDYGTPTT